MKKIIVALAVAVSAAFAQAASVDWKVAGTAATKGYTVYLLTSINETYDSVAALASSAVDSAVIETVGRNTYASNSVTSEKITKDATYYYAIVENAESKNFSYVEASGLANSVYDTANQESSPGYFSSISAANILGGAQGTIGQAVPEPTSGLLLLLGMAGLALRRKQK